MLGMPEVAQRIPCQGARCGGEMHLMKDGQRWVYACLSCHRVARAEGQKPAPVRATMEATLASEHDHQARFVKEAQDAAIQHPELLLLYSIPNGGYYLPKRVAQQLKDEGLAAGVPDLCLPVARGGYHGLYLEFKKPKAGKVADAQKQWRRLLEREGYKVITARGGWRAAWDETMAYLTT